MVRQLPARSAALVIVALASMAACGSDPSGAGSPGTIASAGTIAETTTTTVAASPPTSAAEVGAQITFAVTFPPAILGNPSCSGTTCVYPLGRTGSTLSGDVTGTTVSGGAGAPTPSGGYDGVGIKVFEGTIAGCGTGTVMWTEHVSSADGVAVTGDWTIAPNTGTADLAGITGHGIFEGATNPDSSGTVTGSGTVDC